MSKKLEVEFACDDIGNHKAEMVDCTTSQVKECDSEEEQRTFIEECTYVYNLDSHLGIEKSPHNPNPVIDAIEEQIF